MYIHVGYNYVIAYGVPLNDLLWFSRAISTRLSVAELIQLSPISARILPVWKHWISIRLLQVSWTPWLIGLTTPCVLRQSIWCSAIWQSEPMSVFWKTNHYVKLQDSSAPWKSSSERRSYSQKSSMQVISVGDDRCPESTTTKAMGFTLQLLSCPTA